LQAVAFWGVLVFLLEALLFVLLGQQLPSILGGIKEEPVWLALVYVLDALLPPGLRQAPA
jgi:NhaP-type Na+/H+ or K+/H+ antiporter